MLRPLVLALLFATGARAQWRHVGPFDTDTERIEAPVEEDEGLEAESDPGESDSPEVEARTPQGALGPDIRYTADLSDPDLGRRWVEDLGSLGSISVGFADQGRLINAVHMGQDEAWICRRPDLAWGAKETVESLALAFRAVHKQFPGSPPARLSHIGARDGGYLRPHRSHQSGRDADIGFFYKGDLVPRAGARRARLLDPARNWALLRALITQTDVQVILVDRSINRALHAYALSIGEDAAWLQRVFQGRTALVQHARHHRDHFHVRFYAPRSQELGRRIQPLLARRPEQNLAIHKVRRGQTLSQIARMYGASQGAVRKVNHLRSSFLHVSQRLLVPLRKPCVKCPLPPPVSVPPRCLPPAAGPDIASASTAGAVRTSP